MTYVVHGEPAAASTFAGLIRERLNWKAEVAKYQQKLSLE